jgi:hypothetical protein
MIRSSWNRLDGSYTAAVGRSSVRHINEGLGSAGRRGHTLYRFLADVDFTTDTFFEGDRTFDAADRDRRAVRELAAECEAVLLIGIVFAPPFFDVDGRPPSISLSCFSSQAWRFGEIR